MDRERNDRFVTPKCKTASEWQKRDPISKWPSLLGVTTCTVCFNLPASFYIVLHFENDLLLKSLQMEKANGCSFSGMASKVEDHTS